VAVSLGEADVSEELSFVVNGRPVSLKTDGTAPLLSVLRDELKLRGTKFGCGTEQCGACMVLIDGKPEYSCSREVASVTGKAVTTLEGLAVRGALNPLQRALLDEQAGQCGYCLPGILISATALLANNPKPSRADIIAALDPHLCRCGIHNRVIRAVQKAAATAEAAP
jgi:nicotinate dehydrogenase subunit A